MSDFAEWLDLQLKERDWRPVELARRAGIDTGMVSNLLNRKRNAGPETCRAIAHALDLPEEEVFRKAGLLSPKPEEPPNLAQWVMIFLEADEEERDRMIEVAKTLLRESKK